MHPDSELAAVVRAALADIERASAVAVEVIKAAEDLDCALAAVKESHARVRQVFESHAELRTEIAGRVWDAQRLSLAALAARVGVSKSRAEQMIKEVKRDREGES